jgi:isopenicillin-N epimerase
LSKDDFKLRKDIHFLNHGSYGACPKILLDEQKKWINLMEEQPVLFFRELASRMQESRQALADYVGAKAPNICYVTNSTFAVNVVA